MLFYTSWQKTAICIDILSDKENLQDNVDNEKWKIILFYFLILGNGCVDQDEFEYVLEFSDIWK